MKGDILTNDKNVKVKKDSLFKTIFGTEEGKPLLETLLKDILQQEVKIIEFKDKELPIDNMNEKTKIIDLLVRTNDELVHIEVNSRSSRAIRFRNYVYFSKIIVSDQEIGKKYKSDQKYISINLTCSLSKKHDVVEMYWLQDDDCKKYIDNVAIYEVNLDKARELCYNGDKREDIRHIGALTMTRSDLEIYKGGDEFMENLAKKLDRMDANEFWYITPEEDEIMILNAEKAMARKDGLEEGRAEGLAQGRAQGLAEGKEEAQGEIIRNMLNNGFSSEDIAKYTNADIDKVKEIESKS